MEQYGDPPNSFTLLRLASFFDILPLAENLLLKKGLINHLKRLRYLNKEDDKGPTALIWAANKGQEALVGLLVEKGANIEAKSKQGRAAQIWADKKGQKAVAGQLIGRRVDIGPWSKDGEEF